MIYRVTHNTTDLYFEDKADAEDFIFNFHFTGGLKITPVAVMSSSKRKIRTHQEVVDDCNELARKFYRIYGYASTSGDFKFRKSTHPQEQMMWDMSVLANQEIDGTDVENALSEIGE